MLTPLFPKSLIKQKPEPLLTDFTTELLRVVTFDSFKTRALRRVFLPVFDLG